MKKGHHLLTFEWPDPKQEDIEYLQTLGTLVKYSNTNTYQFKPTKLSTMTAINEIRKITNAKLVQESYVQEK